MANIERLRDFAKPCGLAIPKGAELILRGRIVLCPSCARRVPTPLMLRDRIGTAATSLRCGRSLWAQRERGAKG